MIYITVTTKTGRVLGNMKRLQFNLQKSTDTTSYKIATRIRDRARINLSEAEYSGRHHLPGLIAGTERYKGTKRGQYRVGSQSFDENGDDYAPFVEYGTKQHWIDNPWGWTWHPHQWNNKGEFLHPGTYKSHTKGYFQRAVTAVKVEAKAVAENEVNNAIKRSGLK